MREIFWTDPVAKPAIFSTLKRGYDPSADGTIVKFLAFGMNGNGERIEHWYQRNFSMLGENDKVRQHIFGISIGRSLRVGRLITIPGGGGQKLYDWVLEFWFDTTSDAHSFLGDASVQAMWNELESKATDISAALYRGQEMLVIANPVPHREDD